MPYPNFHACRVKQPGEFQQNSIRTMVRGGIHILIGKLKGETKTTTQAFRYPKGDWTADRARAHCQRHKGSFEAARKD